MHEFKAKFKPVISDVKPAREWLGEILEGMVLDGSGFSIGRDSISIIGLCFSEILSNTIEYSNPPASEIEASVALLDNKLYLEIEDDGGSFCDFEEVLRCAQDAHEIPNLDEGGRGLYLVHNMCSNLEYLPKDGAEKQFNRTVMIYDVAA